MHLMAGGAQVERRAGLAVRAAVNGHEIMRGTLNRETRVRNIGIRLTDEEQRTDDRSDNFFHNFELLPFLF